MPRFDGIQLVLQDGFSRDEAVAVTLASRSMVHFIERRLAARNFESEYTKLNIDVSKSPVADRLIRYKEPKRFIGIAIQVDPGEFLEPPARFHQVCANMVRMGLRAASHHVDLPLEEVSESIDEFFKIGFVNQWTHADKIWKRAGVRSAIQCDLRTDAFVLTQRIYRGEGLTDEAIIARTKPREWLFYPFFGKLTLSGSEILYRAKGRMISRYDLKTGEFQYSCDNIDQPPKSGPV